MNNCPRCYNSEIGEKDNYCKICGTNLRGKAAAGTTASIENELQLLSIRKRRIEKIVTDPEERQRLLVALEVQRCSLESLQQRS